MTTFLNLADYAARQQAAHAARVKEEAQRVYGTWDGKHCAFLYSAACLADFPEVPRFHPTTQKEAA